MKKKLPISSRCPAFSATSQPHTSSTGCFFKALCKAGRTMANAKAKGVATWQKWINFWSKVLRYWHSKNLLETPTKNLSRCLLVFYMTPFDFDSNVDVTFTFWFFASELEEIKALKDAPEQWHWLQQQCPAKYVPRHCKCLWKCISTGNQVEKCCMSAKCNQSNSDPHSKAITRWHFVHRSHTRNLCRSRTVMVGAHEDGRNVTHRFCQFCQAK